MSQEIKTIEEIIELQRNIEVIISEIKIIDEKRQIMIGLKIQIEYEIQKSINRDKQALF